MTKRVKCDKCGKEVADSEIINAGGYNWCERCVTLLISSMRAHYDSVHYNDS
jgi:DNA-directed RNA polymerase subunit RPC12/RpoP